MNSARFVFFAALIFSTLPLLAQQKQLPKYADSEAAGHAGEEAIVTGKVVAISKSQKGTIYLNFGERFPKQVFSGVVLVRDQAKVGDLKAFEGKAVELSGKIELSQDQKPQIVISAPEQLKAAGGETAAAPPAPSTPAPIPTKAATPAPAPTASVATPAPPAKPAPKAPAARRIALAPNWNSAAQGGEMTRKDLATLLAAHGKASESTEVEGAIIVFPDVPFLMPLAEARKVLKLEGATPSKNKVTCPGLPIGSFSAYAFSGIFLGGFNNLSLVTDNADQVVSVILVDATPRTRSPEVTDLYGYHTYNFISGKVKGTNDLIITHAVTAGTPGVIVVDSALIDPTDNERSTQPRSSSRSSTKTARPQKTGKVLERSRWFVPSPIVNLILRCVGSQ
jgi:hypothetical protein